MKSLSVLIMLLCIGCVTTGQVSTIPEGCADSVVYSKIPGFMPNGPMITRVTVSTALATASTAGHPEIKLLVATIMPMLYRAVLANNLPKVMAEVQDKLKAPVVVNYATPFLVLFDSLTQAGVIKGGKIGLTECDKNILASLFKNIGLDSGTDPVLFQ